ncbi:phage tail tape measure protein [Aggregatibacter sp. 2125159857]|uniref:phage tail tape measure protein n=1 Tax=Aggregatibacter sp. 2125159857 TaxID=2820817 RepID=UPI001ADF5B17|nr:phage tail tape measure protein [Aggregatibacter sp. 2125159857]QTO01720.1 phage tail tape measure protein [Aggregatibacter sp. 2125159857]
MNNLQLTVLLNAIDKISAPMKNASKSIGVLSEQLKTSKMALKDLEKLQNKMSSFSRQNEQIKKSSDVISKHTQKLENLRRKASEMKHTRINLKTDISDHERYYQSLLAKGKHTEATAIRFKIMSLSKEYESLKESIKKNSKSLNTEHNSLKASRREKAKQLLQLRNLRKELKESGINTKEFTKYQGNLAEKIKLANTTIEKQQAQLDKLNTKQAAYSKYRGQVETLKDISGKAQMVGAQASAAGATITAPLTKSVSDFMNFEDAMVGVARQVQGLKDNAGNFTPEFDEWKNKIQALSTELPLTTVEIANMIESAARMDIPKDELEDFVRLNTQMATAFDAANPDELTENFGKVSKNWNLSIQASKELADSINYLDDNAISKGDAIIGFMNRLGGISAVAKITDKNVAALGSTLMTFGSDESSAANAVSSTFSRLSRSTTMKPVKRGLKALGLDASKIQKGMVKDAQGTLMTIIARIKTIPEHLRSAVLTDIVGGNYGDEIIKLVNKTDEWKRQIALANDELAQGSMNREFQTRMKALSSTWGIFKNQIFNLNSTIGGTLAPTLDSLMKKIGGLIDKGNKWIQAHPKLAKNILLVAGAIGGSLTVFGALAFALSFVLYPIARLFLGVSKLNILLPKFAGQISGVGGTIVRWLLSPLKLLPMLLSPVGIAFMATALLIYKYWNQVKAFFGGFWEGLKSGLAPVIEKFKPLGALFGVVVEWLEKAVKWFTDLISPVQSTQKDLDAAASAGKKFGEWLAAGIDLVTKPLQWLMDSIQWVIDHMPSIEKFAKEYGNRMSDTATMAANTGFANGGYVGNGGKYEPMGIVHGGEYVMTKETTSRLGVPLLNALNYGKNALLATGLSMSVATAAPIQVDNRPPLAAHPVVAQSVAQPMAVNITINAAPGQDERTIARMVAQEMQRIQNQQQARQRSSLRDRN